MFALSDFNPDQGGHLVLWDLKLVIRFLRGSTVIIPSAMVKHSNASVNVYSTRYSITQYSAGGDEIVSRYARANKNKNNVNRLLVNQKQR